MKKMNKKGFTLIELLAVIIILGILMIIAIPSVTTYIQNSRKSAYVDTAAAYIDAVRTRVNEGKELKLFQTNALYLVPVGNVQHTSTTGQSCVSVESGGKSPFSDEWDYAYVGVVYNGTGYDYYFIGQDGAKQGIAFVDDDVLNKDGTSLIYTNTKEQRGDADNELKAKLRGTDTVHKVSDAMVALLVNAYSARDNEDSAHCVVPQGGTEAVCDITIPTDDEPQFKTITGNNNLSRYVIIGTCEFES